LPKSVDQYLRSTTDLAMDAKIAAAKRYLISQQLELNKVLLVSSIPLSNIKATSNNLTFES
jgi:hypothetical protein